MKRWVAPSFLDAFRFQNLLALELGGRQHPVPDVLAYHRIVEHLYVIEHMLPGVLACLVGTTPDALTLER